MNEATKRPISMRDISPRLINELALGIHPPSEVFRRFGYTPQQAQALIDSGVFARALKEAKERWQSIDSAEERVRLKALIALEEMLPSLFAMAVDEDISPTARNDTFKAFQRLAGVDRPEQAQGQGGPGFQININLGETRHEIVVDASPTREDRALEQANG